MVKASGRVLDIADRRLSAQHRTRGKGHARSKESAEKPAPSLQALASRSNGSYVVYGDEPDPKGVRPEKNVPLRNVMNSVTISRRSSLLDVLDAADDASATITTTNKIETAKEWEFKQAFPLQRQVHKTQKEMVRENAIQELARPLVPKKRPSNPNSAPVQEVTPNRALRPRLSDGVVMVKPPNTGAVNRRRQSLPAGEIGVVKNQPDNPHPLKKARTDSSPLPSTPPQPMMDIDWSSLSLEHIEALSAQQIEDAITYFSSKGSKDFKEAHILMELQCRKYNLARERAASWTYVPADSVLPEEPSFAVPQPASKPTTSQSVLQTQSFPTTPDASSLNTSHSNVAPITPPTAQVAASTTTQTTAVTRVKPEPEQQIQQSSRAYESIKPDTPVQVGVYTHENASQPSQHVHHPVKYEPSVSVGAAVLQSVQKLSFQNAFDPTNSNAGFAGAPANHGVPVLHSQAVHNVVIPVRPQASSALQPATAPAILKPDPATVAVKQELLETSLARASEQETKPLASGSSQAFHEDVKPLEVKPEIKSDDDSHSDSEMGDSETGENDPFSYNAVYTAVSHIEDYNTFFLEAGNAAQFDDNVSVNDALKKLGLQDLTTPLPRMSITLMPHQAIGVAWMLEKERGVNKGGCLCDEMGLGKTVQMIATIMSNPSDDPAMRSTLIICPLSLLDQWKLEIELKTDDSLQCLIYHGSSKPKKLAALNEYDVVLTTLHTLLFEWPEPENENDMPVKRRKRRESNLDKSDSGDESEKETRRRRRKNQTPGLLFRKNWYRIVLDEAQNIRNKNTRLSRSITNLNATYRWCLTGTPITNGLVDAYGLLRFLRIRPWNDWEHFHGHVSKLEKKQVGLATRRLQAIFASCLLRRKKDSKLDGKRLVELPEKTVELLKLEFTKDERDIYQMVETKSQQIFNRYLRAGTVLKNYAQVLVLLLRLRQICSHTSLITEDEGVIVDHDLDISEPELRQELIRAQRTVSRDFVHHMRQRMKQIVLKRIQDEKNSADAVIEDEECPVCCDNFSDPVATPCGHIFCRDCVLSHIDTAVASDDSGLYKQNERPCPVCRGPIDKSRLFMRQAFMPTDRELNADNKPDDEDEEMADAEQNEQASEMEVDLVGAEDDNIEEVQAGEAKATTKSSSTLRRSTRTRMPVRRFVDSDDEEAQNDDDDDLSDFIVPDDAGDDDAEYGTRRSSRRLSRLHRRVSSPPSEKFEEAEEEIICGPTNPEFKGKIKALSRFLPSTKMMHMMETLIKWAKENPGEKTMIVSQWTQCLQLVSDYLSSNNVFHVKYQGDMSRAKRDAAVRTFMKDNDVSVMLMSLKCGGVGLNLTRGNRVISLDLGWSEAVENQAFDRVHRLGQTRPVVVQRLVISNTVEDRVLSLQERKKNLADGSLGEGSGKKIGRLSVRELANLFGLDVHGRRL